MGGSKSRWRLYVWLLLAVGVAGLRVASSAGQEPFFPQGMYTHGQNIAPAYEGWMQNSDGTFDLLFGYMNRNWEEQPHIPIGPRNSVEPGGPDQGQPTHFFPRRNRHIFSVRVPQDFGSKEVVWTLTVNGRTERAYATLKPDYALDEMTIQMNEGASVPGERWQMVENRPPVVRLEGNAQRTVKVGEPLKLNAAVRDDGLLKLRPAPGLIPGAEPGNRSSTGLRVAWFVYRGPAAHVTFHPEQFHVWMNVERNGNSPWAPGWTPPPLPPDGQHPVQVTFSTPGTFVLRLLAHDGGLKTHGDGTVTVTP